VLRITATVSSVS